MMSNVYEIWDSTDDEVFYPLGIYSSIEKAKRVLQQAEANHLLMSEYAEDYERIVIREHILDAGCGIGKLVHTMEREWCDGKWVTTFTGVSPAIKPSGVKL